MVSTCMTEIKAQVLAHGIIKGLSNFILGLLDIVTAICCFSSAFDYYSTAMRLIVVIMIL